MNNLSRKHDHSQDEHNQEHFSGKNKIPYSTSDNIINMSRDLIFRDVFSTKNGDKDIQDISEQLSAYMQSIGFSDAKMKGDYKMIFSLLDELTENMKKFSIISDDKKAEISSSKVGNHFQIEIESFCNNRNLERLKNILDINPLSYEEISSNHGENMGKPWDFLSKGGAGLGFIALAKLIKLKYPNFQNIYGLERKHIPENNRYKINLTVSFPLNDELKHIIENRQTDLKNVLKQSD